MNDVPIPGQPVRGSATGQPIMALFDLLGRAWAMGIVWQLQNGPLTFRQLQDACGGVSPSLLNRRLKELRHTQIVERDAAGYVLSPIGDRLAAQLGSLAAWSDEWATHVGTLPQRSESDGPTGT